MSLLNDALRKKRVDEQSAGTAPIPSLAKQGGPSNPRRKWQWMVIIFVCVISAATLGGWFYWTESDAASGLSAGQAMVAGAEPHPVESEEKPDVDIPLASPVPAASNEPKVAAVRVKPVKPSTKQPDRSIKTKKAQAIDVPPARVKPKLGPKSSPVRSPEKKTAKIAPPKKSPPKTIRPNASKTKAPMAGTASRGKQSESLYNKARQYHRQGRIQQAIALYQEVIKVNPEHHKARFNIAAAYLQIEAYTQAYPIIADIYHRQPDNPQVMLNLAIAHLGCGRYPEALDLLNNMGGLASAPLFEIAFHKGVVYSHLNQTQMALDWYKRAEALQPDDPRLLFNLAVLSDQQQTFNAAVDYYSRHLDHNPDIDPVKKKQIRRRIRALRTYNAEVNVKE